MISGYMPHLPATTRPTPAFYLSEAGQQRQREVERMKVKAARAQAAPTVIDVMVLDWRVG